MASGDAPTLDGLACMHFRRASSVLNVTKAHTQRLCPESSLLVLMDSCSCCTFFCTCIAALTHSLASHVIPQGPHTRMHAHTHTHTRTHTHACTHAHTRADTDRQTQTRTHTHCSADICMSFCVSLTPQQGKAAVMSWERADSLFAFLFVFCVFDFLELLP